MLVVQYSFYCRNYKVFCFHPRSRRIAKIPYYRPLGKDVFMRLQLAQSTKQQLIVIAGPLAKIQCKFEAKIPIRSMEKRRISTPLLSGPV